MSSLQRSNPGRREPLDRRPWAERYAEVEAAYFELWDHPDDAAMFEDAVLAGEFGPMPSYVQGVADRRARKMVRYWVWLVEQAQNPDLRPAQSPCSAAHTP